MLQTLCSLLARLLKVKGDGQSGSGSRPSTPRRAETPSMISATTASDTKSKESSRLEASFTTRYGASKLQAVLCLNIAGKLYINYSTECSGRLTICFDLMVVRTARRSRPSRVQVKDRSSSCRLPTQLAAWRLVSLENSVAPHNCFELLFAA